MPKITPDSLMTLEAYAKARPEFRARIIAHKKDRTVHIGAHLTLQFEDELTMRYQVQEMLRAERIFEEEGILEELGVYNPLIPDGANWKATMMIEFPDVDERAERLRTLRGIEDRVWVSVDGMEKVYAIADEDLEREDEKKTSAVHFLRFELKPEMVARVKEGARVAVGVDHSGYTASMDPLPENIRNSLAGDLA
jgi:Protein of unknown function (DUF3501)